MTQSVEVIEDRAREPRLRELLNQHTRGKHKNDRVLVFALYKKEASRLEGTVSRWGFNCASIHGDKTQDARERALAEFKDGSCPILVATDVAARGVDIPDVELVLNYTFPLTIEDYVHRIGRTGRAGKSGLTICFFCPESKGAQDEKTHAGDLAKILRDAGQPVPAELEKISNTSGGNKASKKKAHPLFGAHFKSEAQMAALEAKKVHTKFADSDDE